MERHVFEILRNRSAGEANFVVTGGKPITTERIAKALNCSVGAAEYGLNMAKRMGLVRQVGSGWIGA